MPRPALLAKGNGVYKYSDINIVIRMLFFSIRTSHEYHSGPTLVPPSGMWHGGTRRVLPGAAGAHHCVAMGVPVWASMLPCYRAHVGALGAVCPTQPGQTMVGVPQASEVPWAAACECATRVATHTYNSVPAR